MVTYGVDNKASKILQDVHTRITQNQNKISSRSTPQYDVHKSGINYNALQGVQSGFNDVMKNVGDITKNFQMPDLAGMFGGQTRVIKGQPGFSAVVPQGKSPSMKESIGFSDRIDVKVTRAQQQPSKPTQINTTRDMDARFSKLQADNAAAKIAYQNAMQRQSQMMKPTRMEMNQIAKLARENPKDPELKKITQSWQQGGSREAAKYAEAERAKQNWSQKTGLKYSKFYKPV